MKKLLLTMALIMGASFSSASEIETLQVQNTAIETAIAAWEDYKTAEAEMLRTRHIARDLVGDNGISLPATLAVNNDRIEEIETTSTPSLEYLERQLQSQIQELVNEYTENQQWCTSKSITGIRWNSEFRDGSAEVYTTNCTIAFTGDSPVAILSNEAIETLYQLRDNYFPLTGGSYFDAY